jgi:hypothetical protein
MQPVPLVSYEELISIVLAALAVMLAILGVGIGTLAIWGYVSLRQGLHEMATRHVAAAMEKKLSEYPTPDVLIETIQKKIVAPPAPNKVAVASNAGVQEQGVAKSEASLSEMYPGEEPNDAHDHS